MASNTKDFREQKALDEARKAGTAEPEKDEEGRDINPHIPQYIAKAPWYLSKGVPSLQHQRKEETEKQAVWYIKGARLGPASTSYRKGACENCGAMTHKTKECVERPRKYGAKLTGKNIEADEVVMEINLDYDGKRDRWNGYDPSSYKEYYDKFQLRDEERQKFKTKQLNSTILTDQNKTTNEGEKMVDDDDDEGLDVPLADKDEDERELEGQTAVFSGTNPKNKTSVKNLRIREDTAKYLYNLSDNSAHYDPKTRSMRENPLPDSDPNQLVFAGDNALRNTGQWKSFVDIQRYAWEASEHGQEVHMVGIPSQAELSYKSFKEKKEALQIAHKKAILEKYGGEEYLKPPEEVVQLAETENFVQYSRDGKVLGGRAKAVKKSKYEEDVYTNGHTSIWGSLYRDGKWGYACCGQVGNRSVQCRVHDPVLESTVVLPPPAATVSAEAVAAIEPIVASMTNETNIVQPITEKPVEKKVEKQIDDQRQESKNTTREESDYSSSSSSDYSSSSSDEEERKKKTKKRKHKAKKSRRKDEEEDPRILAKKLRYHTDIPATEITEEEYEKYKKTKMRSEDPMRDYVDK